ncbi:uncharacterized protein PRCAT00003906001 [Priceomyces carsonii]|uniref:uncharacterized protein n=1 Tax=Priceomyces carsonii TaxID=28549 RepID=UPI002EDB64EB|nr:unnamed protein product [Priceomyces carsonii]
MSSLKDHYYRLASEVNDERIEAASALLSLLIEVNQSTEWDYALNRLIKGLTTTRQSARYGFSMALTELVRELLYRKDYELSMLQYLELVLAASEVKSNMKGKEERAVLFGRLFGLQALLNSKVLFDESLVSKGDLSKFVDALISLSVAKTWLREPAMFTLCQFISLLLNTSLESVDHICFEILEKTNNEGLSLTTEGVAVFLSIPKDIRDIASKKISYSNETWKNWDPLSRGNLNLLAKVLKETTVEEGMDSERQVNLSKQKGNWSPRVSFVWDIILERFMNPDGDKEELSIEKKNKKRKSSSSVGSKKHKPTVTHISLKEFWKVVIDETFFSEKSSHERKYWGFVIFNRFLNAVPSEDISYLFSPNLMRCLINQVSQSSRFLYKTANGVLNNMTGRARKEFLKAPSILSCLLDESKGGCWNFDFVTKTKTVDSLITILGQQDLDKVNGTEYSFALLQIKDILFKEIYNALSDLSDDSSVDEEPLAKKANDHRLKWFLDKVLLLTRSIKSSISKSDFDCTGYFEDVLKLLIKLSFFKKRSNSRVSLNFQSFAQEKINSCLAEIINTQHKKTSWPYYCISCISKLEGSEKYESVLTFDDELQMVKDETLKLLDSILDLRKSTKNSTRINQLYCFEILFSMVLLLFYMGDEEAILVLEEVKLCFESLFTVGEDEENIDSSIVLVEIILSFVSKKSNLLKKLSFTIWETFLCTPDENGKLQISEKGLQLLYDVLTARENLDGLKALFDTEDNFTEEGNENDKLEEDDDVDDDSQSASQRDSGDDDSESNDDLSDDSDEDTADAEDASEVNVIEKETNLKLAKALGIPEHSGEVKFDELSSLDEESGEESDMDDDDMMAMDEQLSKIFKERQDALSQITSGNQKKAEAVEAKEQVILFKNRVLDLLEIFVKLAPNSHLNLTMIKPLLVCIRLTLDKNIGAKAHKLLKTRISKTKITDAHFNSAAEQNSFQTSLLELVEWIQSELVSSKASNQSLNAASSQACIIVSKNLVSLDPLYLDQIVDIYCIFMKKWALNSKAKIQPTFLYDFINWLSSKRS